MERTFFLGLYPGIGDAHLNRIAEVAARFMGGERA
jgi:hypothetical protein